jgi:hypothetical protein
MTRRNNRQTTVKRTRTSRIGRNDGRIDKTDRRERSERRDLVKRLNEKVEDNINHALLELVIYAVEHGYPLTPKNRKLLLKRFGEMVEIYTFARDLADQREESETESLVSDDVQRGKKDTTE